MSSLILTIFCSITIALLLKYNDCKKGELVTLLVGNYLIASVVSQSFLFFNSSSKVSLTTFFFGVFLAFPVAFSFFVFAKAVEVAGTALASISIFI